MSILPMLTARAVARKLLRAGFRHLYTKGSHYYFRHPVTGCITSVPFHAKDIGRGLLRKIISQAGLTVKMFLDL
jgi:predicted RNA binding protein YcfA (HicA-like mRNA interferase family)